MMRKNFKKMIGFCICAVVMISAIGINASAVELPDGGQIVNTDQEIVTGRSSGGIDGYARLECTIYYRDGALSDIVTAVTKSDVATGLSVTNSVLAWYAENSSGETYNKNQQTATSIPVGGFEVSAKTGTAYGTKGTAAHSVTYDTRGTWICGTTVYNR